MKLFVNATKAPRPLSPTYRVVMVTYAALLTVLAVSQLFKYEDLVALFSLLPTVPAGLTPLEPALLVVAEVFAIPYLLGMTLSPLFRLASRLLGIIVAVKWLYLGIAGMILAPGMDTGILGTVVPLGGLATTLMATAMLGLAIASNLGVRWRIR